MSKRVKLLGSMIVLALGIVGCQSQDAMSGTEENGQVNETDRAYKLVWEDQFEGDELNLQDWNYEYHEPGWVNAEWQEYVDAKENIYVKDGHLVIQPIKSVDADGNAYYTSGRVNTQNKHDFLYGKFEARLKVPSGKGFLPAFWMMPTDESFYGQWPKCGEIDIMEVLGDQTDTLHGTLHFGEPHTQKQGTYKLAEGDFAEDFHVFACEWEPGEMRFYVDGELYFTEKDWFTKRNGFGEVTYPAPYDQPFYMILNVAVGGSWVGYPDDTTQFEENAQMVVDYVRVYQKDSYDENVEKPTKEVALREADTTGNYVVNHDFSNQEVLDDDTDWKFLLAGTGKAEAAIQDKMLQVVSTNAGDLEYSVQVVQPNIPLEKGCRYRYSFDARAEEARTMITGITAPDLNYIRYFGDNKVELTTELQNYSFEFDMLADSDPNGRVEYNLGKQGSTATVYITNVRVERIGDAASAEAKTVLPDGNYVYNGSFSEGKGRLGFWNVVNDCKDATVEVTNLAGVREFKATVPQSVEATEQLVLKQNVALAGGKDYKFTFTAYGLENNTIQARVGGQTFDVPLTTQRTEYVFELKTVEGLANAELEFLLGTAGTIFLDDVRIQENGMLVNGDFINGLVGYEVYLHESTNVTYGVDELTEDAAMGFTIKDTGDQDWQIQLKQNNVKLEKEKWYRLQFDAKSTIGRKLLFALQRDGSADDNWIPYSGSQFVELGQGYQTYVCEFQMLHDTDEKTILSISMGAVEGRHITEEHTIFIDNIVLEEVVK